MPRTSSPQGRQEQRAVLDQGLDEEEDVTLASVSSRVEWLIFQSSFNLSFNVVYLEHDFLHF